jgi:hypothetical protein
MADETDGTPDTPAAEESPRDSTPDSKADGKDQDAKSEQKQDEDKDKEKKPGDRRDEDTAQRDQFADAARDPLADALGGASARAGESQAYQSYMRKIRASGATAFVGGGSIGALNITAASGADDRRVRAPGVVPRDSLDELIVKYAPVDGYHLLLQKLAEDRLLVLRGAAGTGRSTTGLRLLDKVAESVARFSPGTDPRSLTDTDFQPDSGLPAGAGTHRAPASAHTRGCRPATHVPCRAQLFSGAYSGARHPLPRCL